MYRFKTDLIEATKNKIHFISPWNDELNDLDYTKTVAVTHKIENDGRKKGTKGRFGSQVRKEVKARKDKEHSELVSRTLRRVLGIDEMYHTKDAKIKKRFWNVLELSEDHGWNYDNNKAHERIKELCDTIKQKIKTKEKLHSMGHKGTPEVENLMYEITDHGNELHAILNGR